MSVTLREKPNSSGVISLYLDIYHNGKRYKEYLKDCKIYKATNPAERKKNKDTYELANSIRVKREQELISQGYDVMASFKSNVGFMEYFDAYIEKYTKKDKRNMEGARNRFKDFMDKDGIKTLTMKQLTENIVHNYAEYLSATSEGEGASSYFKRFKKMIKQAVREKVILSNPAEDVSIKRDESIVKAILTIEEIQILVNTAISNKEVRNAFLFCCFTGLAWIDVKELKWRHINLRNSLLTKVRAKTDTETVVTLNKTALSLLPAPKEPQDLVFTLPSFTGAGKLLKNWAKSAEIGKHITWHCARHTFATLLISNDTDVTIVAKLMGHSTVKHTQRYTRIAEDLKRKAVNNLPQIDL